MAKRTKKAKLLSEINLVAMAAASSKPAVVNITFKSGTGQATVTLFRKGVLINMQSISSTADIHLAEVQTGDAISVNGVCAGTAEVRVSVDTDPATPTVFAAGSIHIGYDVL